MFISPSTEVPEENITKINVKISGYIQEFTIKNMGSRLLIFIGDALNTESPAYEYCYLENNPTSQYEFHFAQVVEAYHARFF